MIKMDEKELIAQAYGRLQIWRDGCKEMHERAKESRKIILLEDPRQDEGRKTDKKTIQLQTLKSTFNNCIADQMDNMPEALMVPETKDLTDVADDLTDLVRFILNQNNYELVHRRRVEDFFCTGTAVTQVAWDRDMDNGKGNVAVLRWPVEAFLWDPAAENIQDARALFKVSWHPMSWYEQHYPDKFEEMGSDETVYSDLAVPESQETDQPGDEQKAMLIEYWYRVYDAKKRHYTINVAYLAGGVLLEKAEDVYSHGMYPFVVDAFTPIEGIPVGDGMVQELAPMMRYINRYASYIDMNLRMASKGRLLVNRNAGIDKEALIDWENDIVEGDRIDASALQWMQTTPFTSMVTAQMLQLQNDIKQDSGQNQFTRGETAGGVTAASAISALQEAGGKMTRMRTNALNSGFREIVEQIMWLISQFYDKGRVLFVTGRKEGESREVDASPEHLFGKKNKGTIPPPPYTVQVQVQRRNPLRQQAQNELFMQAYSMSAQAGQIFPLSVLFELLQVDGKDKILPILRQSDALTQQMQQLSQQNQMLTQQNAELQQSVSGLQQLNDQYAQQMRGGAEGMYPSAQEADQALPDVEGGAV